MNWSHSTLKTLLEKNQNWLIESEGDCLSVSNDEGFDAFIYAGSEQLLVETALFPASAVKDSAKLNDLILRTHQLMPLTTICIHQIGDEDFYVAFGSLSINSKESVVLEEIEALFANVGDFLDMYNEFLKEESVV
ncbi:MAG: DUF2170 family protein [Saccharospirillaceae bacterium]|nr:YjfI family protein [Pseudomonadales bacterium]NRB79513.1 DUF2170 family protein [Saccharospirillaceae bacterium]